MNQEAMDAFRAAALEKAEVKAEREKCRILSRTYAVQLKCKACGADEVCLKVAEVGKEDYEDMWKAAVDEFGQPSMHRCGGTSYSTNEYLTFGVLELIGITRYGFVSPGYRAYWGG